MNRTQSPADASARSPFAGCAILIAALLVMIFLIGFSIFSLFRQFNAIAQFTAVKPVPVTVAPLENQEAALNGLAVRLEAFRQQLADNQPASLALTADEMNLAIATYDAFRDFRGTLRVVAVEGDTLRLAIAFPLNGKPRLSHKNEHGWITSDPRYLNGELVARPALLKAEVVLQIDTIQVPGAQVPREFIEQMSPYRMAERYLTDPLIGPSMGKLTRVGVADGKLVLSRIANESPADSIDNAQLDASSRRLFRVLGFAACGFLIFAGLIVILNLRAKAKRS